MDTKRAIGVHTERLPYGSEIILPSTPVLDEYLENQGIFSGPTELMPMMEQSREKSYEYKLDGKTHEMHTTGFELVDKYYLRMLRSSEGRYNFSDGEIVDLAVRYLAYEKQKESVRGKKQEQTYDKALEELKRLLRKGIGEKGIEKIEPDSEFGLAISKRFVELKIDAFEKTSERRKKGFLENGQEVIADARQFSKDFNPKDIDQSGAFWIPNANKLASLKSQIAYEEGVLDETYGIKPPKHE